MPNGVVIVVAGDDKTGEVFNAVKRHLDETKEKAHETSDSLGEIGEKLKGGLEAVGIGLGLREVFSQFKEAVSGAAEFGESIAKAGERTGIAAGTLSVLHYAAAVTGTDFDKLVAGASKLGKNMADAADGNKKAAAAFQAIGVNAKDLVGRTDGIDIALQRLGKTLADTESPARRNQIAMDLLGKAGSASVPVLIDLAEGFDQFKQKAIDAGVYLDQMSAEKLQQLNQKMLDLQQRVLGAKVAFSEGLEPALVGLLAAFQNATGGSDAWQTAGRAVGTVALWSAEAFSYLSAQIRETIVELQGYSAYIDQSDHGTSAKLSFGKLSQHYQDEANADNKRLQDAIANHKKIVAEDEAFRAQIEALYKKIQNPAVIPPPEKSKGGDPNDHGHEPPPKPENTDGAERRLQESRRQLADEVSKVDAARAKSDADTSLAILDAMHKQQLVSDATYYAQKAAIQRAAFEDEHSAILAQQTALAAQIDAVEAKKPKTEKDRLEQGAQLNDLHKQELALDSQLLELDDKRRRSAAELDAAHAEAIQHQRDQIAQMEAELEHASGAGASKAIAEARLKAGEERTKLSNGGATPQELAEFDALEKLKEAKLQVQALDRQGDVIRRTAELAEAKVMQAELSHAISQKEAEQQLNVIRGNELVQLQALARAYAQYGEAGVDAEARVQGQITQTMQQMEKQSQEINQSIQAVAHSIFDPLFDMSEKWSKKWQSISKSLERDLGQLGEKQLFGALFGDEAAGGKGRGQGGLFSPGGGRGRAGIGGVDGLLGNLLGGLFGKKNASATSNGGLGGGAGTVPSAAASLMQLGGGAAGATAGIQVVLNNQGPPMQVDQTTMQSGDGGEGQVIQIMLKQLETNGPVAQGISALFNL